MSEPERARLIPVSGIKGQTEAEDRATSDRTSRRRLGSSSATPQLWARVAAATSSGGSNCPLSVLLGRLT